MAGDRDDWLHDPDRFELEPKPAEFDRGDWIDPDTGRLRSVRDMINARQRSGGPRDAPPPTPASAWTVRGAIAMLAVAIVGVTIAYLLISHDDRYRVTATFENASSLVGGERVVQSGVAVGSVKSIELADDNQVEIEMAIDDDAAPVVDGTIATVRWRSLSGIANRQVELTPPPDDAAGEAIPDGGTIDETDTVSQVELDELFNTLSPKTVKDLKAVIKGFADSYEGVEQEANQGFRYLNPLLFTGRRVFEELARDEPTLERLVVDADRLTGALAERRDNVAGLISNASTAMGALAEERTALAASIAELPGFLRQFNTTAVNLRSALDDVDPLVDAAKPVAVKLQPFLAELNSASENLVPTVRDLDETIDVPGDQDLVGLAGLLPDLNQIAAGPVERNGKLRAGAFPETVTALEDSLPIVEQLRPYAPELVGWFNDFGPSSGIFDANGGITRIAVNFNQFLISESGVPIVSQSALLTPNEQLNLIYPGRDRRCPGANERPAPDGSNPFTDGGNVNCDPTQLPGGS